MNNPKITNEEYIEALNIVLKYQRERMKVKSKPCWIVYTTKAEESEAPVVFTSKAEADIFMLSGNYLKIQAILYYD